jgi:membrane fusion protein (multidrug efflux system)
MPLLHTKSRVAQGTGLLLLTGAAWTLGWYLFSNPSFQKTEDAYVTADFTLVAPKIAGLVETVLVEDNQAVHAGQLLVKIDDRDLKIALEQARANVASANASIRNKQAGITSQKSIIDAARAQIDIDEANQTFAEQDNSRYAHLASKGYGSVQNAQQAASRIASAKATVARDTAALETSIRQLDVLKAELAQAQAEHMHDEAILSQAQLNLSYTKIRAPIDGIIGRRSVRPGAYVNVGSTLLAVVPISQSYILANFQESQIGKMRLHQPVSITVDAYPGMKLHGHIDSLAPATDVTFSPIQPDNATGNFTKIVQRVPVKIVIESNESAAHRLRVGMSVISTVDVRAQGNLPVETNGRANFP